MQTTATAVIIPQVASGSQTSGVLTTSVVEVAVLDHLHQQPNKLAQISGCNKCSSHLAPLQHMAYPFVPSAGRVSDCNEIYASCSPALANATFRQTRLCLVRLGEALPPHSQMIDIGKDLKTLPPISSLSRTCLTTQDTLPSSANCPQSSHHVSVYEN